MMLMRRRFAQNSHSKLSPIIQDREVEVVEAKARQLKIVEAG